MTTFTLPPMESSGLGSGLIHSPEPLAVRFMLQPHPASTQTTNLALHPNDQSPFKTSINTEDVP